MIIVRAFSVSSECFSFNCCGGGSSVEARRLLARGDGDSEAGKGTGSGAVVNDSSPRLIVEFSSSDVQLTHRSMHNHIETVNIVVFTLEKKITANNASQIRMEWFLIGTKDSARD